MKRSSWLPCAAAALLSLALTSAVQAQTAVIQSSPAGYASSGYGYTMQPPTYRLDLAPPSYGYTTRTFSSAAPTTFGYSAPTFGYTYARTFPQPGYGHTWQSRVSYAGYARQVNYAPGYSYSQPYYFAGRGYGTTTRGVLPNGVSYRSWQVPFQMR